jgi:hypothetical protein
MSEETNIIESMKQYIKMSLDDEFTKIKNNLLKELDNQMEMKRNNLVEQVLNATDIQIGQTPMGMNLNISIEKIIKVVSNE